MTTEGTTLYCGDTCNHTGPHRYPPVDQPPHVHKFIPWREPNSLFGSTRLGDLPWNRRIYCETCGEVRSLDNAQ